MRTGIMCVLSLSVAVGAWTAQYQGTAVNFDMLPETPFVGGQVTVSGYATRYQDNSTVTAIFTDPDGEHTTLTADLDDEGAFAITCGPLLTPGAWQVSVEVPLSGLANETGEAEFTVYQPAAFAAVSVGEFSESVTQAEEFVQVTAELLDRFTQLPQKDEARSNVNDVQDSLSSVDAGLAELSGIFEEMGASMEALQAFPEMHEAMVDLAGRIQMPLAQAQAASQELHYTHETANNARAWCRTWHAQKQGLQIVKQMVQFIFAGSFSVKSWVVGKFTDAMKEAGNKLADEAVMQTTGMTAEQVAAARDAISDLESAKGRIEQLMDPEGNLGDLAREGLDRGTDWLIDWISSKVAPNCSMYDATVKGKLHVEYYAKGVVYMVTKYIWDGKIEVFFRTRQSETDVVKLRGQIWGNFGWRIGQFFPERLAADIPGVTGVGLCIPRPPHPDIRDFYLTLEGEGKPEGVELWVTGTEYDVERLPYRFISVLWSPYQLVPTVDFPECQVPGGEWFVTRVTGLSLPNQDSFYIPLTVEDDQVILKHTFERTLDYREQHQFRAFLKMEVDGKEDRI